MTKKVFWWVVFLLMIGVVLGSPILPPPPPIPEGYPPEEVQNDTQIETQNTGGGSSGTYSDEELETIITITETTERPNTLYFWGVLAGGLVLVFGLWYAWKQSS